MCADFTDQVLKAFGAFRICQLNFMAARDELAGKGSPNIAGAANSDFHFNNLLTHNQYSSCYLARCANESSVSQSRCDLG
ncbi:hypothetical protein METHPM2_20035 [Pseudomonas sp. PM2]